MSTLFRPYPREQHADLFQKVAEIFFCGQNKFFVSKDV